MKRPVVCIQGLGFVGAAMATAVAMARTADGQRRFHVVGLDLPTPFGLERVEAFNNGSFPFECQDPDLLRAFQEASAAGNLVATTDPEVLREASIAVVDIHLDLGWQDDAPHVDFTNFRSAIDTLGTHLPPGALVLVETTVPPGTTERVVRPTLNAALRERGLPEDALHVAHSYERVMPGQEYLQSITQFWRVFASPTEEGAALCETFLSQVIDVENFPLTRLDSTTASETAKVLENSYRATTIAFMEEWGRFAEAAGFDLFPVIDAIRMRPTHSNMRQPGFGVGGYCLTKDPLFAWYSAQSLLELPGLDFPFCRMAVEVNQRMPTVTLDLLRQRLGTIRRAKLLLLGVSYRQDVGDTRHSPSEVFWRLARAEGAELTAWDPHVTSWEELDLDLPSELPSAEGIDAVVFCVPHRQIRELDLSDWLGGARPLVVDANRVLTSVQRAALARLGLESASIGNGAPSASR